MAPEAGPLSLNNTAVVSRRRGREVGTSDKVCPGRPPPSVTHSPETPMGGGGSGEGGGGGPGRAHHPEQVKGTAPGFAWRGRGPAERRVSGPWRPGGDPDLLGGARRSACFEAPAARWFRGRESEVWRELFCYSEGGSKGAWRTDRKA